MRGVSAISGICGMSAALRPGSHQKSVPFGRTAPVGETPIVLLNILLPYEVVNFDHRATCDHHSFIGHLGLKLTLAEGFEALVCFRFEALLQFGKRRIRVVNTREVRQVVDHVDHE